LVEQLNLRFRKIDLYLQNIWEYVRYYDSVEAMTKQRGLDLLISF